MSTNTVVADESNGGSNLIDGGDDRVNCSEPQPNGDHCIFCLRVVSTSKRQRVKSSTLSSSSSHGDAARELLSIVPKAVVSPGFLSVLNSLWPRIHRKKKRSISLEDILGENGRHSERSSEDQTFSCLPTLCQLCADEVHKMEALMEAVRSQLRVLKEIIVESRLGGKYFWRQEQFQKVNRNVATSDIEMVDIQCGSQINQNCWNAERTPPAPVLCQGQRSRTSVCHRDDDDYSGSSSSMKEEPQLGDGDTHCDIDSKQERMVIEQADADDSSDPTYVKLEEEENSVDTSDEEDSEEDDVKPEIPIECNLGSPIEEDNNPLLEAPTFNLHTITQKINQSVKALTKSARPGKYYFITPTKCPVGGCSQEFDSKRRLTEHLKTHPSKDRPFQCSCGEGSVTEKLKRAHFETSSKHIGEEYLTTANSQLCDMCGESVSHQKILEHLRSHVGDYAFKCPNPMCKQAFSNTRALRDHFRANKTCSSKVSGGNAINYACEICSFATKKRHLFRSHLMNTHERSSEKTLRCPLPGCDEMFSMRQSVDLHISLHSLKPITTQTCDQCSETIKIEAMPTHLIDTHQAQEILKCEQCSSSFTSRISLIAHFYVHRFTGMYCDICGDGVKYMQHTDLRRHYSTAHQIDSNESVCDICGTKVKDKQVLRNHMRTNHPSDSPGTSTSKKKSFQCDICIGGVQFKTDITLLSHKIRVHNEEPFRCKSCDATFLYKHLLSRHEKEHTGIKVIKPEYKCNVDNCGKVYSVNIALRFHKAVAHNDGRDDWKYKCDECDKLFMTITQVKSHDQVVHLGMKPFVCDICGEGFTCNSTLKKHNLIHSGERPHPCDICGQRFRHREVLRKHLKSHEEKGADFKPNGPMKQTRKRVKRD